MKTILLPILKFVAAMLLCLFFTGVYALIVPCTFLWEFRLTKEDFEYRSREHFSFSPYFKSYPESYYHLHHYKTFYHYVFGIYYAKTRVEF